MKKKIITETEIGYIPTILEVAGLIHDIGNPPLAILVKKLLNHIFKKSRAFLMII